MRKPVIAELGDAHVGELILLFGVTLHLSETELGCGFLQILNPIQIRPTSPIIRIFLESGTETSR